MATKSPGVRVGTERCDVYLQVIPAVSWSDDKNCLPAYHTMFGVCGYWLNCLVTHDDADLIFTAEIAGEDPIKFHFKAVPGERRHWSFETKGGVSKSSGPHVVDDTGHEALNMILEQYFSFLVRDDPEQVTPWPTKLVERMIGEVSH